MELFSSPLPLFFRQKLPEAFRKPHPVQGSVFPRGAAVSVIDLVVDHLGTLKIVVDGVDRRRRAGVVDEPDTHKHRTGDPVGAVGGIKVFSCVDVSVEFGGVGVGDVASRKESCNIPEVGDTAESRLDQFGKAAVVDTEAAAVTGSGIDDCIFIDTGQFHHQIQQSERTENRGIGIKLFGVIQTVENITSESDFFQKFCVTGLTVVCIDHGGDRGAAGKKELHR